MPDISKVSGVAADSVGKIDGVSKASIGKLNELSFASTASIVTTNLALHLDAGDSSSYSGSGSTWFDLTSNNIDFSLINSPTYSSSDGGGSFQFDGVDDEISSTYSASSPILFSASDLDTNGATFQLWAKNVSNNAIQFNTNSATSNHYFGIEVIPTHNTSKGGGKMVAHIFEGTANNSPASRRTAETSFGVHNANVWYLFTWTFGSNESSDIEFALNASSVARAGTSGTGDNNSPQYSSSRKPAMGRVRGVARQGHVSQVLVYNRVLSSSEIAQNFNATKARYGY
tara:strand:+ start:17020 stop:17877 length:858 start_codon:yes stop_codon:yes gene_type:complete